MISDSLQKYVDEYRLTIDGISFWTPYFINSKPLNADVDRFTTGPYKGKGTPAQLQGWVRRYAASHQRLNSPEEWRQAMINHRVGIDCSGFAYHVLDSYLKESGKGRLSDHIYIPRRDLIGFYDQGHRVNGVTRQHIESYPEHIRLSDFCRDFSKNPRKNTNVARLVGEAVAVQVTSAGQLMPGDMAYVVGPAGDHIMIVISIKDGVIRLADSLGLNRTGVSLYDVRVTNPAADIDAQDWGESKWYLERYEFKGMRRLKALAND